MKCAYCKKPVERAQTKLVEGALSCQECYEGIVGTVAPEEDETVLTPAEQVNRSLMRELRIIRVGVMGGLLAVALIPLEQGLSTGVAVTTLALMAVGILGKR